MARHRIDVVINLMPHVWTPFVMGALRATGTRYAVIAHDADAHPGDRSALVKPVLDLDIARADRVLTLSEAVARRLVEGGHLPPERIRTLFHPDLAFNVETVPAAGFDPPVLRLLFLGRILPYKGLPLLAEAFSILRAAGTLVELSVMGEGDLGEAGAVLARLGARIENRWLSDPEIGVALAGHDVVVLSHVEASQSGVVATAFGAGLPVVSTPVGGLTEQIADGRTGLLADAVTGSALASALMRLAAEPTLLARLRTGVAEARGQRSMHRFLESCVAASFP